MFGGVDNNSVKSHVYVARVCVCVFGSLFLLVPASPYPTRGKEGKKEEERWEENIVYYAELKRKEDRREKIEEECGQKVKQENKIIQPPTTPTHSSHLTSEHISRQGNFWARRAVYTPLF